MVNDSFLTLACAGLIGLIFGTVLTFAGYRLFIVLLPIWGFFFGLALGAQSVQVLFGDAFLATAGRKSFQAITVSPKTQPTAAFSPNRCSFAARQI